MVTTLVLAPTSVGAHQDPPGCLGIDNSMRLVVTRNDGSPVVGTVTECETLKYQAELMWDDECLIQGGTFKLVTPDGVDHVVANPVPCLGDATTTAEGCMQFQGSSVLSPVIPYTVSPGDAVAGNLTATAVWENGSLHQAPGNVSGQGDMRAILLDMMVCDNGNFCDGGEVCDPEATNGIRLGLCVAGTPPDCGTSDECTERFCSEELDECVETDTSGRCGASDFCVERGCDPESGCFETDNSEIVCPDGFCTEQTCNPETSQCDQMDVSAKCGESDQCAERSCNEDTDMCDEVDTSGRCGTGDFCVERGCNPETGCFVTDNSDTLCPDGFCTEQTCNPETSQCDQTDVSAKCGESDECTDRTCNEETDMCDEADTSGRCGTSDFCVARGCVPATGCFVTDNSDTLCPDGFCTEQTCNPETSQCDQTDVSAKCGESDECTDRTCNEATDMCDETDTSGRCGTSDQCAERGCDPESGCFDEDTSGRCEDANLCTSERCDPVQGCVMEGEVHCNGSDPCHPGMCNPETGQCEDGDDHRPPFFIKLTGRFGNGARISGGLGVNLPGGLLRLGRNVIVVDGASLSGDIVSIGNGTSVDDVFANKFLLPRDNSAIVNGTVGPIVLPIEEFFCPIPEYTCGGPSVLVPPGGTLGPLDPGVYGPLRMLNGSTLTLKPGTFTFCDFRTGRNVNVRTTGGGATTINVDGKFRLANGSFMGPANGSPTPVLNVNGRRMRIGAGSTLQALVSAPEALITLGRGSKLTGMFCACRGRSDKNITLECPPFVESPSGAFLDPIN